MKLVAGTIFVLFCTDVCISILPINFYKKYIRTALQTAVVFCDAIRRIIDDCITSRSFSRQIIFDIKHTRLKLDKVTKS
jgi:hypothetical protein